MPTYVGGQTNDYAFCGAGGVSGFTFNSMCRSRSCFGETCEGESVINHVPFAVFGNAMTSRMRGALQGVPFIQWNWTAKNGLNLPEQHADLRNRVLGIGRDGLAVLPQNQELVARARIWAVEA